MLEGFCEFLPDSSSIFGNNRIPEQTIAQIYDAIHGPTREGWMIPSINSGSTKALPGGNEVISCRGLYHQLACSVYDSAKSGIPLVNDVPGLSVFSEMGSPSHDARLS